MPDAGVQRTILWSKLNLGERLELDGAWQLAATTGTPTLIGGGSTVGALPSVSVAPVPGRRLWDFNPNDVPQDAWRPTVTAVAPAGVTRLELRSVDERPLPLQVDGDYIGEVDEAIFGITPRGIAVVA